MTILRLQLWLKLTLSWRGHRANKLRVLSVLIFLFVLVPVTMIAVGLYFLLQGSHPWLREPIARDGLAIVSVIWILAPLLGFQMNESYDVTKLFAYPLSYGQIFLGSVIGSLIDPPVLLVFLPMASLWLAFSHGLGALAANGLLLFLFLLQTISTAQAITIILIGFLRSRRFRDITIVIFPIIGLAYYLGQQALVRQFNFTSNVGIFMAPIWRFADWLPAGFTATGIAADAVGNWRQAAISGAILVAFTVVAMSVAALALKRLYLGDVVAVEARQPTRRRSVSIRTAAVGWLPSDIATMMVKELAYLRRDPQYKAMVVQIIYTVAVIAIPFLMPAYGGYQSGVLWHVFRDLPLFGVAGALLLSTSPLLFNVFGGDGAAVTVLFSLPTPRRRILMAKNLAHAITVVILILIGLIAAATATGRWTAFPLAMCGVIIALPILLSAGNLTSIRLPHRMIVRGQRWQRGGVGAGGFGCAYAFLYLVANAVTTVVMVPVLAALILPVFSGSPGIWYAISLPLAAAYSAVLYVILLGVAEGWLMSREPEIAAAVSPPD